MRHRWSAGLAALGLLLAPAVGIGAQGAAAEVGAAEVAVGAPSLFSQITAVAPGTSGGPTLFDVVVHNVGPDPVLPTDVDLGLSSFEPFADPSRRDLSASGAGWLCAPDCVPLLPVLPGGATPALRVSVDSPPVSELVVSSTLRVSTARVGDPLGLSRVATATVPLITGPAPSAALVLSTDLPRAGQSTTATALVHAVAGPVLGPVTVELTAPADTDGARAEGTGWTCTLDLRCQHPGPVPAGGTLPALRVSSPQPAAVRPDEPSEPRRLTGLLRARGDAALTDDRASVTTDAVLRSGPARLLLGVTPFRHLGDRGRDPAQPLSASLLTTLDNPGSAALGPVTLELTRPPGVSLSLHPQYGDDCPGGFHCRLTEGLGAGARLLLPFDLRVEDWAPDVVTVGLTASWELPAPGSTSTVATFPVGRQGPNLSPVVRPRQAGAVASGEDARFVVSVRNHGDGPTTGQVDVVLDNPFRVVDEQPDLRAGGPGWTCLDLVQRCTTEAVVGPGQDLPDLLVDVPTGPAPGAAVLTARTVTAGDTDPQRFTTDVGDDIAVTAQPLADPAVVDLALSATPLPTDGGMDLQVRNLGELDAPGPVEVEVPGSADGSGWTCTATTCRHAGPVPAGQSLPSLRTGTAGTATVVAPQDGSPANGTAEAGARPGPAVQVLVTAPPPAPLGTAVRFPVQVTSTGGTPIGPGLAVSFQASGSFLDLAGAGWTCSTPTCTYGSAVSPGEQLPPIVATVPRRTPADGPAAVRVSASVAGAGSSATTGVGGRRVAITLAALPTGPDVLGSPGSSLLRVANAGASPVAGPFLLQTDPGAGLAGPGWTCGPDGRCAHPGPAPARGRLPDLVVTRPPERPVGVRNAFLTLPGDTEATLGSNLVQPQVAPVVPFVRAQPPPPVRATFDLERQIRVDFSDPVFLVSDRTVRLERADGVRVPVQLVCDGPCDLGSQRSVRLAPLVAGNPGEEFAVVLDLELRGPRDASVSPLVGPRLRVPDPLADARVTSVVTGTTSPRAASGFVFDRDTAGIDADTVRLFDSSGRRVPAALSCSPGPCGDGPARAVALVPSAPLLPGRAYGLEVRPPVVGVAVRVGLRAYAPAPVRRLQTSPTSTTVARGAALSMVARALDAQGRPVYYADLRLLVRTAGSTRFSQVRTLRTTVSGLASAGARPLGPFSWFVLAVGPDGRTQASSAVRTVLVR